MKLVFKSNEMEAMTDMLSNLFRAMGQKELINQMFDDINALDVGETISEYPYTVTQTSDEYIFELDDELIVDTTNIFRKYVKPIGGIIKGMMSIMESLSGMLEQLFDEVEDLFIDAYEKYCNLQESKDEDIIINEDAHIHLSEDEVRELFEQESFKSEVNKNMEE